MVLALKAWDLTEFVWYRGLFYLTGFLERYLEEERFWGKEVRGSTRGACGSRVGWEGGVMGRACGIRARWRGCDWEGDKGRRVGVKGGKGIGYAEA